MRMRLTHTLACASRPRMPERNGWRPGRGHQYGDDGEIALLRGGARTASVAAATELRVRVIQRGRFARVMRMLPTLARSVECVTRERIAAIPAGPATLA